MYAEYCAACHEQVDTRIPTRDALAKMSPARILRTLDFGQMMSIAYPMRRDEREAVARFLGKGKDETALPASAFCKPDRTRHVSPLPRRLERLGSPHRTTRASRRRSARAWLSATSDACSSSGRLVFPVT